MGYDERYEVQSEEKQRALRTIATLVDEETPEGMGFAVFLLAHEEAQGGKG